MTAVPDISGFDSIERKRQAYVYFLKLRDGRLNIEEFKRHWETLGTDVFNPKQLSVILYSAARKIEFIGPDDYTELIDFLYGQKQLNLWSDQAKEALPLFNTRDLSQSLWSLAKIAVIPSLDFVQNMKDRSLEMMRNFNAYDLTDILWSFSHMGIHPGADFMKSATNRLNELLPGFTKIDYTKAIRSLTILSALQNNRIPSGFMKTLLKRENSFSMDSVLAMQLDMAGLWYDLPQYRKDLVPVNDMPSRLKQVLQASFNAQNDNISGFGDARAKIDFAFTGYKTPVLLQADYTGRYIYDIDAEKLRYNGLTQFQNAVLKILHPEAAMIRLRDPATAVISGDETLSRLRDVFNKAAPGQYMIDYSAKGDLVPMPLERPPQLEPAKVKDAEKENFYKRNLVVDYFQSLNSITTQEDFVSEFYPRWQSLRYLPLGADELALALSKMASIFRKDETPLTLRDAYRDTGFFGPWYGRALQLDEFDPAFLCASMNSFADLGVYPRKDFAKAWLQQAFEKLPECNTDELVKIMRGHSRMAVLPPRPFLEKWMGEVASRLSDFDAEQLVRLSRTMAIFHVVTGDKDFLKVSSIFLDQADNRDYDATHISRNNQVRLLLGKDLVEAKVTENHISNWEELLEDEFRRQDFPLLPKEEQYIPELNRMVDFIFDYGDRKVVLETDGPGHFVWCDTTGAMQFNGSTQLQTALLEKLFPDDVVIRLNYLDVKDFKSKHRIYHANDIRLVTELGQEFAKLGSGSYQSYYADGRIGFKPMFDYIQHNASPGQGRSPLSPAPQDRALI